jgi:hypothetical protein
MPRPEIYVKSKIMKRHNNNVMSDVPQPASQSSGRNKLGLLKPRTGDT